MEFNIALGSDSYKASHWKQYPPGTRTVGSYFESRGVPDDWLDEITVFGLQYFLIRYLHGEVVTHAKVDEAAKLWALHFGTDTLFNEKGWRCIVDKHNGRLPVRIRCVPEGMTVPSGNVIMTIENTDPECFWLTNWLETLLVEAWYPMTVCSQSRQIKKQIQAFLEKTGDPSEGNLIYKLHDFGFRGVTCPEQAALGGAAHLVNFAGTDTVVGALLAREYYIANSMPGHSIPASEHSTITAWGRTGELDAFRNMLKQYPTGLVACVSDSYDIYNACSNLWGKELREEILARDGTLVVRPDSGEPPIIVLEVLARLANAFGYTVNEKGYKVLPPQIRVIQGDGITKKMIARIYEHMDEQGWSGDNLAFGSGGGLLQKMSRDTINSAFKCSWIDVDGEIRDVYKQPRHEPWKTSRKGKMKLVRRGDGSFETVGIDKPGVDILTEVFCDGEMQNVWTFQEIQKAAAL